MKNIESGVATPREEVVDAGVAFFGWRPVWVYQVRHVFRAVREGQPFLCRRGWHNWSDWSEDSEHAWRVCRRCGKTNSLFRDHLEVLWERKQAQ